MSCPSITPSSKGFPVGVTSNAERMAEIKAVALAFLAEHNLPFVLAPDLLDLAQRLAEDRVALRKVKMSRTCATYTSTHGLGGAMKEELDKKIRATPFSLNLDEATNNNDDKIVNMIVQFFDNEKDQVVVQHFGSMCINIATAQNIFESIVQMFEDRAIPLKNLVSCLMDNCPTMRGCRGGVETLIRKKQPALLDVAGDTVHILSNAGKTLFKDFYAECEKVCELIYYDSDMSGKSKEILAEMQYLLNMKFSTKNARGYLTVLRPCQSRFLNMMDVTERLSQLKDALLVYYFSYLTKQEQQKHKPVMAEIFDRRGVGDAERSRIEQLQRSQGQAKASSEGQSRKDIILTALFQQGDKFFMTVDLYRGILPTLNSYVKKFQSEKPLCHLLHGDMVAVTRNFVALFIKPEAIPEGKAHLLKGFDVSDETTHLSNKNLSVGKFAYLSAKKARIAKKYWISDLYQKLRKGYIAAAKVLLDKLPMTNSTIIQLSCLHPAASAQNTTRRNFEVLAEKLSNVVPEEQLGELDEECRKFSVDTKIAELAAKASVSDTRIDTDFWSHVFKLTEIGKDGLRYPTLTKLVKAVISVFCGPIVESSFNLMDDAIRPDRSSLQVEQYEASAIVKSTLKAQKKTATTFQVTRAMKKSIIEAKSTYNEFLHTKKQRKVAARNRRLELAVAKKSSGRTVRCGPGRTTNTPVLSTSSCVTTSSSVCRPSTTDGSAIASRPGPSSPAPAPSSPAPGPSSPAPGPSSPAPGPTSDSQHRLPAANKSSGNRKRAVSADIRGFFKKPRQDKERESN